MQTDERKRRSQYFEARAMHHTAKSIGHKLSLAMTEEDDARLWRQYRAALDRWQRFSVRAGCECECNLAVKERVYYKPVFDETYLKLTAELTELYAQMQKEESRAGRRQIRALIDLKKRERGDSAHFVMRETGEAV